MKSLYVLAGCNGAGKTTASYTLLPEILDCREFVNADEIARGLSPFNPENVNIQAGKLMLERIKSLIEAHETFAFETTLATLSHVNLLEHAKDSGYEVTLVFFWLDSPELAVQRVKARVNEGGHDIPENVVRRRYGRGLKNFFRIFKPISHYWFFVDNSIDHFEVIAQGDDLQEQIFKEAIWKKLKTQYHE